MPSKTTDSSRAYRGKRHGMGGKQQELVPRSTAGWSSAANNPCYFWKMYQIPPKNTMNSKETKTLIFLYQCYETYPSKIDPHVIASNSIMFIVDS